MLQSRSYSVSNLAIQRLFSNYRGLGTSSIFGKSILNFNFRQKTPKMQTRKTKRREVVPRSKVQLSNYKVVKGHQTSIETYLIKSFHKSFDIQSFYIFTSCCIAFFTIQRHFWRRLGLDKTRSSSISEIYLLFLYLEYLCLKFQCHIDCHKTNPQKI